MIDQILRNSSKASQLIKRRSTFGQTHNWPSAQYSNNI